MLAKHTRLSELNFGNEEPEGDDSNCNDTGSEPKIVSLNFLVQPWQSGVAIGACKSLNEPQPLEKPENCREVIPT